LLSRSNFKAVFDDRKEQIGKFTRLKKKKRRRALPSRLESIKIDIEDKNQLFMNDKLKV